GSRTESPCAAGTFCRNGDLFTPVFTPARFSSFVLKPKNFFGGDEAKLQDYLKFRDSLTGLKDPTRISDVIASGLDQYDAVFVPGGHGPMIDLLDDLDAGTVMRHFHNTSKPTAVLCHGPISLLSALPNSTEVVGALKAGDAAGAQTKAQGWIYSG